MRSYDDYLEKLLDEENRIEKQLIEEDFVSTTLILLQFIGIVMFGGGVYLVLPKIIKFLNSIIDVSLDAIKDIIDRKSDEKSFSNQIDKDNKETIKQRAGFYKQEKSDKHFRDLINQLSQNRDLVKLMQIYQKAKSQIDKEEVIIKINKRVKELADMGGAELIVSVMNKILDNFNRK